MGARLPVSAIRRIPAETKEFTFTDTLNPDCTFTVTLKKLGAMAQAAANDLGGQMVAKYVGYGIEGNEGYVAPTEMFPPIDGQAVHLSESTCQLGTLLECAQTTISSTERYPFEDLVSFMTVDSIANQMAAAAVWVQLPQESGSDPLATSGG